MKDYAREYSINLAKIVEENEGLIERLVEFGKDTKDYELVVSGGNVSWEKIGGDYHEHVHVAFAGYYGGTLTIEVPENVKVKIRKTTIV